MKFLQFSRDVVMFVMSIKLIRNENFSKSVYCGLSTNLQSWPKGDNKKRIKEEE